MVCLQILASRFGQFLGSDNAMLYCTRATGARIHVEVDLQDELVEGFPLVIGQKQIWQKVTYEKRVFYFKKCFWQGHTTIMCRSGKKSRANTSKKEGMRGQRKEHVEHVWKEVGRNEVDVVPIETMRHSWNNSWNSDMLLELVGAGKTMEILHNLPAGRRGADVCIWKLAPDGNFSTKSAWEATRSRGKNLESNLVYGRYGSDAWP